MHSLPQLRRCGHRRLPRPVLCRPVRRGTAHGLATGPTTSASVTVPTSISAPSAARLAEAMASSAVLAALCLPNYFASQQCGREWQLFSDLLRVRRLSVAEPTDALLPVVWVPSQRLPDAARRLQHTHESFGPVYRREGAHHLSRLRRYRDDYHVLLTRLAERIVAAARPFPPPAPSRVPDLESVRSAFAGPAESHAPSAPLDEAVATGVGGPAHRSRPLGVAGSSGPSSEGPTGPRHVHFVVVAGSSSEVAQVRSDTRPYGRPRTSGRRTPPSSRSACACSCRALRRCTT